VSGTSFQFFSRGGKIFVRLPKSRKRGGEKFEEKKLCAKTQIVTICQIQSLPSHFPQMMSLDVCLCLRVVLVVCVVCMCEYMYVDICVSAGCINETLECLHNYIIFLCVVMYDCL